MSGIRASLAPDSRTSTFKRRMRDGEKLLGCFAFLPSPTMVEILGEAGFDFIIIDQEHSPKDWGVVENMVRAAELYDMPALIRVHDNHEKVILHAIEIGAAGIMLPFIENAQDVERASRALYYPPQGQRGTCTQTRAARYSATRPTFLEHAQRQNDRLVMIGLIESPSGVHNIDEILSVQHGLDAVLVGRSDLAASMGFPGRTGEPSVMESTADVMETVTAKQSEARSAMVIYNSKEIDAWHKLGCTVFIGVSETGLCLDALSNWRTAAQERMDSSRA